MTAAERRPPEGDLPERGQRFGRRRRGAEPAVRTVALTSCVDELEHRVTVEVMERAACAPEEALVACCGAAVLPAPLSAPPGRSCRPCSDITTTPGAGRAR